MNFNETGWEYKYYIFENKLCRIDLMTPTQVEILQKNGTWKLDEDVSYKRFQVIGGSNEFNFQQIQEAKAREIYNNAIKQNLTK